MGACAALRQGAAKLHKAPLCFAPRGLSHTLPFAPTHSPFSPCALGRSSVAKDQPILLADGDELCLGDVHLRVALERAPAGEEEQQENSGGAES